ncbi:MAG: response regulator [Gammaproteobacteria bacterium]|jgi:two-component system response regulator RegA|nr:response regulator [Gammaproteobacteria bacterium]|tara:strand:+ start:42226 stop:42753 length:528 start_codon:yes stop_codon:yes gene_type:complete
MSKKIVIVDDDETFCEVLALALSKRGYACCSAHKIKDLEAIEDLAAYDYAVVDLRLGTESGLNVIDLLLVANVEMSIVMLTAYSSIATAVEAVKKGAINYLNKPASVEEIIEKLENNSSEAVVVEESPLSVRRLEWEHLQKVLLEHDGNISAAARALNMHRRTLQRKLSKHPVRR